MKTLYLDAVHQLRFAENSMPKPQTGEALVKVTAVGLCG
jgi:threonine dehydrogenase-like Zn-dependent dehydrogenase